MRFRKALPNTVKKDTDTLGTSYVLKDARNPDWGVIEVWTDGDNEVWIRSETPGGLVDLVHLNIGMATDLLGVLHEVLYERH